MKLFGRSVLLLLCLVVVGVAGYVRHYLHQQHGVISSGTIKALSTMVTECSSWHPLSPESLVAAPCLVQQTLCQPNDDGDTPQLAKDADYAQAILNAWKEQDADATWQAEHCAITYRDAAAADGPALFGHVVRRHDNAAAKNNDPSAGVLFFHTGAGPHDIFLLWKAAALVQRINCVVLIADVFGDATGTSWRASPDAKQRIMDEVLQVQGWTRPMLRQRIQAALQVLRQQHGVNAGSIAALGWCLGGHAVLELARMPHNDDAIMIQALVTFHGVFSHAPPFSDQELGDRRSDGAAAAPAAPPPPDVLICHGVHDPMMAHDALKNALQIFQEHSRHRMSLLQLPAKHGFTNPAQDYNDNDAFAYDAASANKAWSQAVALLQRVFTQ